MKIFHKLLIAFLAIILIIVISGFFVIHKSQNVFKENLGENALSLTARIMRELDKTIHSRIEYMQELTKDINIQRALVKSNIVFDNLDNREAYISSVDREWIASAKTSITPFMRKILADPLSERLRDKVRFYNDKYDYKVFGEVFITNKYGANAAQTNKTSDYRQDDEEWWQSAKVNGLYVRDVAYDESSGVYSTDIAIRIEDNKGNFLGVMKVVLNIEDTLEDLRKSEAYEKFNRVNIKLINRDGRNIYSSEGDKFLANFNHELYYKEISKRLKEGAGYFVSEGHKTGEEKNLYAFVRSHGYEDYQGLGWTLIMEYDTKELFAPISRLNRMLIIMMMIATIIVIIISYFIARAFSTPIEKLKAVSAEIGRGNFNVPIDINTNDEIKELANALNNMSSELQKAITIRDNEINERKKMEEELKNIAVTDKLTQIYNRLKFEELIKYEMIRAKRYMRPLCITIFDLDHFKYINDTFGHGTGDDVLIKVAEIVKGCIRKTTYFFRWGGEEFIIILPEADINSALIQAERIRKAIEENDYGSVIKVTASFGTTQFMENDTEDTLIKRADDALYRAKANGRNRIEAG